MEKQTLTVEEINGVLTILDTQANNDSFDAVFGGNKDFNEFIQYPQNDSVLSQWFNVVYV